MVLVTPVVVSGPSVFMLEIVAVVLVVSVAPAVAVAASDAALAVSVAVVIVVVVELATSLVAVLFSVVLLAASVVTPLVVPTAVVVSLTAPLVVAVVAAVVDEDGAVLSVEEGVALVLTVRTRSGCSVEGVAVSSAVVDVPAFSAVVPAVVSLPSSFLSSVVVVSAGLPVDFVVSPTISSPSSGVVLAVPAMVVISVVTSLAMDTPRGVLVTEVPSSVVVVSPLVAVVVSSG